MQGLRALDLGKKNDNATKKAQYQAYSTDSIRKHMLDLRHDSRMAPAITAYYRATTASTFRDQAAVASRRRLGGALKDKLNAIEYDKLHCPISTNIIPALS